jgi:hypothetical protein
VLGALGLHVDEAVQAPNLAALTDPAGVLIAAGAWHVLRPHFEQQPADFGAALSARLLARSSQGRFVSPMVA